MRRLHVTNRRKKEVWETTIQSQPTNTMATHGFCIGFCVHRECANIRKKSTHTVCVPTQCTQVCVDSMLSIRSIQSSALTLATFTNSHHLCMAEPQSRLKVCSSSVVVVVVCVFFFFYLAWIGECIRLRQWIGSIATATAALRASAASSILHCRDGCDFYSNAIRSWQ